MRKILITFKTAFREARSNLFHTLLSVLGIVIGVGALVTILSLIDGLENHAKEQISQTTSLESILISPQSTRRVDNIVVKKESFAYFNYDSFQSLMAGLGDAKGFMKYQESGFMTIGDSVERGVLLTGIVDTKGDRLQLLSGRFFNEVDLMDSKSIALVSKELATALRPAITYEDWIGLSVQFKGRQYDIIGVIDLPDEHFQLLTPITTISKSSLASAPPNVIVVAPSVTHVQEIKQQVISFIEDHFSNHESDFRVTTNEFRVEQANKGFLVFRLVMGLIVGVAVVVGGVGVMNVLLISVTERTAEIGVRKAVGAKKKDIVLQFLSESLCISLIGSFLGVVFGVIISLIAVPIIKHLTEMPFEAAFTLNTLLIIGLVALATGVVFGTYPALKASRLSPVEAIRRE